MNRASIVRFSCPEALVERWQYPRRDQIIVITNEGGEYLYRQWETEVVRANLLEWMGGRR